MFKVECEGCQAPYDVDERRVPSAGLKKRCPKCGASFLVHKPDAEDAELPAVAAPKREAKTANPSPAHGTTSGGDPLTDLPAFRGGAPPRRGAATPRDLKSPLDDVNMDLPAALGGPSGRATVDRSPDASAASPAEPKAGAEKGFGETDLPAVLSAGLPVPTSVGLPARSSAAPMAHLPARSAGHPPAADLPVTRQPSKATSAPSGRPVSSPALNFG